MADTSIIDIIIKATNKTKQALREPINDLGDLKGALIGSSAMWGAAAGAAAAAGLILAKQALEAGDKALEMSEKIGISTESITTLEYAARKSNLTNEQFETGMQKLAISASNAAMGNKEAAKSFAAAGVSVTDAHGRMLPLDEILLKVSDKFNAMPNNAAKAKMAVDLFGKSGVDMVPMLNAGSAGIQQLQQRARDLGLEISGPAAQGSDQFNDNLADLKETSSGFGRTVMAEILPGLNALLQGFLDGKGLGTAFSFIMQTLGTALIGVFKIVMSAVVEIDAYIERLGAKIAQVMATMAAVATDGWRGAVNAWKAGSAEIERIDQDAADRHSAIWFGTQTGPTPPDPAKHRAGFEEVLKEDEKAKIAMDTQRWAELESIKKLDKEKVESRLAELDSKRLLNQQEAEDFKALQSRLNEIKEESNRKQAKLDADRVASYEKMLSMLVSLSSSKNAALLAIAKAAAIAQATWDTYRAANAALASIPYPINLVVAGVMVAAGLANVATIAGVPGFAAGGVVPGTSYSGDNVLARLNSGEEVFTAEDRRENTRALRGALELASRVLEQSKGGGSQGATGGSATLVIDKRTLGQVIWEGTLDGTIQVHPRAMARA